MDRRSQLRRRQALRKNTAKAARRLQRHACGCVDVLLAGRQEVTVVTRVCRACREAEERSNG
jgi:hypothetical protein